MRSAIFHNIQLDIYHDEACLVCSEVSLLCRIAQKKENVIAREVNSELDSKPETKKLSRKEKDDR